MKKIKLLLIVMVAILCTGLISSCGKDKDDDKKVDYSITEIVGINNPTIDVSEYKIQFAVNSDTDSFPISNITLANGTVVVYDSSSNQVTTALNLVEGLNTFTLKIQDANGKFVQNNDSDLVWTLEIRRASSVTPEPAPTNITVTINSWKSNYLVGESYKTGQVKIVDSKGVTSYVDIYSSMLTGFDTTEVGEKIVKITVSDKVLTAKIYVSEPIEDITPTALTKEQVLDFMAKINATIEAEAASGSDYDMAYQEHILTGFEALDSFTTALEQAGFTAQQLNSIITFIQKDVLTTVKDIFESVDEMEKVSADAITDLITSKIVNIRTLFNSLKTIIPARQMGELVYQLVILNERSEGEGEAFGNIVTTISGIDVYLKGLKENVSTENYELISQSLNNLFYSNTIENHDEFITAISYVYQDLETILAISDTDIETLVDLVYTIVLMFSSSDGDAEESIDIPTIIELAKGSIHIIYDLSQKISLNTYLDLVTLTVLSASSEHLSEINLYENIAELLPHVNSVLTAIDKLATEIDMMDIMDILGYTPIFDSSSGLSSNEQAVLIGKFAVKLAEIIVPAYNSLTVAEQTDIKAILNWLLVNVLYSNYENFENDSAVVENMVDYIKTLVNYDHSTMSDDEAIGVVTQLSALIDISPFENYLAYERDTDITIIEYIVKSNGTVDDLIAVLNKAYSIYYMDITLETASSIEITAELLSNYDLTTAGVNYVTLTYLDCSVELMYYVEPAKPADNYELKFQFENFLVYEKDSTVPALPEDSEATTISISYSVVDKVSKMIFEKTVEFAPSEIQVIELDTSNVGQHYSAVIIEDSMCGTIYVPVKYYVLDSTNRVVTSFSCNIRSDDFCVNSSSTISGSIYNRTYNDAIKIENGRYMIGYSESVSPSVEIDASMVSGFDITKVGVQEITITFEGCSRKYIVTVYSEEDWNKPIYINQIDYPSTVTIDNYQNEIDAMKFRVTSRNGEILTGTCAQINAYFAEHHPTYSLNIKISGTVALESMIELNFELSEASIGHVYDTSWSVLVIKRTITQVEVNATSEVATVADIKNVLEVTVTLDNGQSIAGTLDEVISGLKAMGLSYTYQINQVSEGTYELLLTDGHSTPVRGTFAVNITTTE